MIFYNKDDDDARPVSTRRTRRWPPTTSSSPPARSSSTSGAAPYAIYPSPSSEFFQSWFDFYPLFAAATGGKQLVEDGKSQFAAPGRRCGGGLLEADVRRQAGRQRDLHR